MQSISQSSQKPIVLIAEDHEDTRRVYGMILRHFGYDVIEVSSGAAAVERANATPPDLILMDIGLPVLDGWQAARQLKSDVRTRGIPLIAFSALIDSTADLRSDALSFDGFIAKPVNPSELVRRVAAYLDLLGRRQTAETVSTPLVVGSDQIQISA
jgi:CheY-like chemotaxis protein